MSLRPWRFGVVALLTVGALGVVVGILSAGEKPARKPAENRPARPRLEFRIVANGRDDAAAFEEATRYFAAAREDARRKAELQRFAGEGLPPAGVPGKEGKPGYTWVELGGPELRRLNLDDASETDTTPVFPGGELRRNAFWREVAAARDKGEPFRAVNRGDQLFYSRPCQTKDLPKEGRGRKKFEYFVLTRDPEPGKEVPGRHVVRAQVVGEKDSPAIGFELSKAGGDLLYELSEKNKPSEDRSCSLAIVLDGKVVSAPVLQSLIRSKGRISGLFTPEEAEQIAEVLRSDLPKSRR